MYETSAPSNGIPADSSASRTFPRSAGAQVTCQPSSPPTTSSAPAPRTTSKSFSSVVDPACTSTTPLWRKLKVTLPGTPMLPPFLSNRVRISGAVLLTLATRHSQMIATPPGP